MLSWFVNGVAQPVLPSFAARILHSPESNPFIPYKTRPLFSVTSEHLFQSLVSNGSPTSFVSFTSAHLLHSRKISRDRRSLFSITSEHLVQSPTKSERPTPFLSSACAHLPKNIGGRGHFFRSTRPRDKMGLLLLAPGVARHSRALLLAGPLTTRHRLPSSLESAVTKKGRGVARPNCCFFP